MTIRLGFTIAAMLLVACNSQEGETPQATKAPNAAVEALSEVADTVYTNGKIYSVNEAQPGAEAVAIKNGSFAAYDHSIRSRYSRRSNTG